MKIIFIALLITLSTLLSSCENRKDKNEIHFATYAAYPPFEYISQGEIKGFDIDLARLVAVELGKKAVFDNMQFSSVLPAVTSGKSDAAISTITITSEREKNMDFTRPYYYEGMAVVFKKKTPIMNISHLKGKKMAAQLGSVMDIWLRKHFSSQKITSFNNNNQAIEALIADHIEVVLMDGIQGLVYSQKHRELSYMVLGNAESGYGIALKKGSPLKEQMNQALKNLEAKGEIKKLQAKWLDGASWNQ